MNDELLSVIGEIVAVQAEPYLTTGQTAASADPGSTLPPAGGRNPRRDAQLIAMAMAGQKLAVRWGHQPWSDSWAELVAQTLLEASESISRALESA